MNKQIRTEIEINASAEKVWKILTDFENFPAWNPFVVKASGKPLKDEMLQIEVQLPESKLLKFTPQILKCETNRELSWAGKSSLRSFRGEHFYRIEPLAENKIRFVHGENFSGWAVGLIWLMMGKNIEKGYGLMNEALKKEAEKI